MFLGIILFKTGLYKSAFSTYSTKNCFIFGFDACAIIVYRGAKYSENLFLLM